MKILYVEDELTSNIPKIIRLFRKYLGEENVNKLQELERDEYGASSTEIKKIIDSSHIIKSEHNFEKALNQVQNYSDLYSLFIIDRNLSKEKYNLSKIKEIDKDFCEDLEHTYFEREGDYLLQKLAYKNVDIRNNFYFLTAYSASELPNKDEIKQHISLKKFKENNIIDKSKNDAINGLIKKINNIEIHILYLKNKKYLKILKKKIKKKSNDRFIQLLKNRSDDSHTQIKINLTLLRNCLEDILFYVAKKKDAPLNCRNEKNKEQIVMTKVIKWICSKKNEGYRYDYKFGSNRIIKDSMYSIKKLGSGFGAHTDEDFENFPPTTDTVNALIYQLKDLISWVDKI